MLTLPDHFRELLAAIEPDPDRLELAQRIPADVRDFLKGCDHVQTTDPHTRLAGSYARHTAINNIKDVDILLIVNSDYYNRPVEVVLDAVSSALYGLPKKLGYTGEVTTRRRQRRSVNVSFKEAGVSLDIVPAVARNGMSKPLEIPDREWTKWVKTHPLGYGDALSRINQQYGGKVVPLIKLLKQWRDAHMSYRRPKSYWLESLVFNLVSTKTVTTDGKAYSDLFRDVLGAIYANFSTCLNGTKSVPEIPDPMLGHNVAHNWERADFEAFMERIHQSYNWAQRALMPSVSEEDAVRLWKNVFGDEKFPSSVADIKGRELRRALLVGTVHTTPLGKVFTEKPHEAAIKAPPQRFYGDTEE